MSNNPLDVGQVQSTLSQTTHPRSPFGQLLRDVEIGVAFYFLILFLFWLARRAWGLALLAFFACWIAYACAGLRDWWAIPFAAVTAVIVWAIATRIRGANSGQRADG
jgi:hypothetical protein